MADVVEGNIRAALGSLDFKEEIPGKPLLYRKRVGSGHLYVDLRFAKIFHKVYHLNVRIPEELTALCKELVQMNRTGLHYPIHTNSGSQPLAVQVIVHRKIDGFCIECNKDILASTPWVQLVGDTPDVVRAQLSYCRVCREATTRREQMRDRMLDEALAKARQIEREREEHSREMAELNKEAEAGEKRSLEDRGFDTSG